MSVHQNQRFRLKDRICKVPIHWINNKSFVFLDDIQEKFGCKIHSFSVNDDPLPFVRNDEGHRMEPLRIQASIDEIIECEELLERRTYSTLHHKLSLMIDKVDRIDKNAEKARENSEILLFKVDAILKQTFELAEFTTPRLFIILPNETSKLNPANLFKHSYRLFFLCECEEERHLAFHEGYKIDEPREFFKKYGSYLKDMFIVFKCAVAISSVLIPQLCSVQNNISVPNVFKNAEFWEGLGNKILQMNNALGEITEDEKTNLLPDKNLEGADLRQIEFFLKRKDTYGTLGNLNRSTMSNGSVRWLCIHHYDKSYSDKKRKELHQRIRALRGIVQRDEITINKDAMKNIDEILNVISQGLYLFKLTLRDCKMRESLFDKLLILAGERSYIKYIELYSISLSSRITFSYTQHEIIEKLSKVVEKYPNLTIKYVIECPKDKGDLDPDLFDFALKQSTDKLILHIYTRDDGKKIVLQDLNKPDLLRMITSLNQSKMITHCSINNFDQEISNILLLNTTITNLTLFLVKFDEQKIDDLRKLLAKRTGLLALRFSTCQNLSPLIIMLSRELVNNVELEVLALNGISGSKQVTELALMLEKNKHLIELNLALDTNISFQTTVNILQAFKVNNSLKILKLTGIRAGTDSQDPSAKLFEMLIKNSLIEELTLHFQDRNSKISQFREIIQAEKNIRSLDLRNCNILPSKKLDGICPIILSSNLVSLSLHSCEISFEDMFDLFQGLAENKILTTLYLNNLLARKNTTGVNLSIELAKMLELNTALKKMTYSHGNMEDKAVEMIGEALRSNKTLEELNVSFNRIGTDGAIALADALKVNNTLVYLNIRGNDIKYDGIYSIFQSLHKNLTLRTLYIDQASFQTNSEQFNKATEELIIANEFINIY